MIEIIWEYDVPPEHAAEFERHYGPSGTWVSFFGRADEYAGTTLLRDAQNPRHYVTIDRWTSFDAYQSFCTSHETEYRAIDALCSDLIANERRIGIFKVL